jgi:catechol 2,3-dioxygenase
MPTAPQLDPAATLPATLRLGAVHLTVSSVDRSVAWYQRSLGLRVHEHGASLAKLGDGQETVLVLHEDPQATRRGRHAGLFHYALLYPTREELARAAVRLNVTQTAVEGASDHGTHEAIYLADPDGNGVELAWDRAPELWPATQPPPAPLDVQGLLATVTGEAPTDRVGPGLRVGHLHLHVGSIEPALAFYRNGLGFTVRDHWGTAAFMGAGGYHHHLAVNVWAGVGVSGPPPHTTGLRWWTVELENAQQVAEVQERLAAQGWQTVTIDGGFEVLDPSGTALHVLASGAGNS